MNNKLIYLYCVTSSGSDDRLPMSGIDGSEICCFEFENFKIWFSETNNADMKCDFESLKIHNQVSLALMEKYTVIPFKYGTRVRSKNEVYSLVDKLCSQLQENINKLAGKYEVGVKVFGEVNIDEVLDNSRPTAVERLNSIKSKLDCREYFIDRIKLYEEEKKKEQGLNRLKDTLLGGLMALADACTVVNGKSSRLLINSAFLIKKSSAKIFEEQFDYIKNNNPGFSFLFSGPWPPYNFVKISIEGDKESHFQV